jgi:lipoprotein-releasing system permease protein
MKFPWYIAKRYLVAKKSQNAINIISLIAMFGVTIGTMALIIVLSVFNGFDRLVKSLFNSFDPDIRISLVEGKTFNPATLNLEKLGKNTSVACYSFVLEENALLRYGEKEYIATLKGVDSLYAQVTGIDSTIFEGKFQLELNGRPYAVVGQGVAYYLSIGLAFIDPIMIYVPRRSAGPGVLPANAFNRRYLFPSGIFRIEQEVDSKYIFVPLSFARDLLEYENEISAIEIKLKPGANIPQVQDQLTSILGHGFKIQDRYQQKEFFYKVMRSEKWAIFFILTFILIVASFNIIGSLSMLIIDKKKDMAVLQSMGATIKRIRTVFLIEGWMIALVGAITGLALGLLICWLQMRFGLVRLQGSGSFVIDSYPVYMKLSDFIIVFLTVLTVGFLAAWYPVRFITRRDFFKDLQL